MSDFSLFVATSASCTTVRCIDWKHWPWNKTAWFWSPLLLTSFVTLVELVTLFMLQHLHLKMGNHKHLPHDGTVKTKPIIIGEGLWKWHTQGVQERLSCIVGDDVSRQLRTTIYGFFSCLVTTWMSPVSDILRNALLLFFQWKIIALQYCVGFCYTTEWISHK